MIPFIFLNIDYYKSILYNVAKVIVHSQLWKGSFKGVCLQKEIWNPFVSNHLTRFTLQLLNWNERLEEKSPAEANLPFFIKKIALVILNLNFKSSIEWN